jgi:hypothetical protein
LSENPATQAFAAIEVAARLRPILINGAELSDGVEGDASAVAALVHAADAAVLDHKCLRHLVHSGFQLDHQVAAAAAAGARRKIRVGGDAPNTAAKAMAGDL